jgi:hypothetical protein
MTSKEHIISEKKLMTTIETLNLNTGKIAIIGGHYMLLYERSSDSLKPAIYQDFEEGGNREFSRQSSHNFPIWSFELSVNLHYHFKSKKIESKCIMLVNDESFTRRDFRSVEHYDQIKERGFELRKKYFSEENNLPKSFTRILKGFMLKPSEFFYRFINPAQNEDALVPPESIFVSERRLCKSLKKTVRLARTNDELFNIIDIDREEQDNINELTVESHKINSICLIEKGACNCGGKAFQFYLNLIEVGFDTIIFFVPDECKKQVMEGTDLICNSKRVKNKLINIINITTFDSNLEETEEDQDVILSHFTNLSPIGRASK